MGVDVHLFVVETDRLQVMERRTTLHELYLKTVCGRKGIVQLTYVKIDTFNCFPNK